MSRATRLGYQNEPRFLRGGSATKTAPQSSDRRPVAKISHSVIIPASASTRLENSGRGTGVTRLVLTGRGPQDLIERSTTAALGERLRGAVSYA
jgi:hypothetical protein